MKKIESQNTEYIISEINIADLVPNVIDNVIINIINGSHTIYLPGDMTSLQFSNFTKGKGGVFSKDVLHYTKGTPFGKYILVETEDKKIVCRLIEEEEWLKFQVSGLMHGNINDMPYMILKEVEKEHDLISTKAQQVTILEENINFVETLPEDDLEELPTNLPLFD